MKYLSLFAGIGGFELGIQQAYEVRMGAADRSANGRSKKDSSGRNEKGAGLVSSTRQGARSADRRTGKYDKHRSDAGEPHCIGYSEIDPYAIKIYQTHYQSHENYGDITKINEKKLPNFDFLCGGFPCQSFSIAGQRKGFDDTRGTLFFDIARIIKEKQPRLLLLENVKGLLSHDEGRTFTVIISALNELGYDLQWQVLNSKDFGVPQNRERIFIVGHLRGTTRPQVFPFDDNGEAADELPRHITNTLTARYEGAQAVGSYIAEGEQYAQIHQRPRGQNKGGKHSIAPTLTSNFYENNNHVGGVRRLTPIECERLQGFPDNWTKTGMQWDCISKLQDNWNYYPVEISDTQRYKCLGNAVTVNVIEAIMRKILC